MKIKRKLSELFQELRESDVNEIARRYFVINSFDGVMIVLSLLLSFFFTEQADARFILIACLSASFATMLSGIFGAYFSESAERTGRLRELEKSMLRSLKNSEQERRARIASVYIALVDGLSPLLLSLVALSPMFACIYLSFSCSLALRASIALCFVLIFALGFLLGRIAKRNPFVEGAKITAIGGVLAFVLFLLEELVKI